MKLFKSKTAKARAKRKKKQAQSPEPLRVLIGSTNGTKQDADSLARTQIERYFDTPDQSWIYIVADEEHGHHFEIHQGGDGRPYLPAVLALDMEEEETLIIRPEGHNAVEVMLRTDRAYQSLVLPEKQSEGLFTDTRLIRHKKRRMKPYATTGSEWIKVGVAALSLGILTITVAGILHKSFSIALNGYYEIAEELPVSRLIELGGNSMRSLDMPDMNQLPLSEWERLSSTPLARGEAIAKMYYRDGLWQWERSSAPQRYGEEDMPSATTPPADNAFYEEGMMPSLPLQPGNEATDTVDDRIDETYTEPSMNDDGDGAGTEPPVYEEGEHAVSTIGRES